MAKKKTDSRDTLIVIGLPNGEKIKAVAYWTVEAWLDALECDLTIRRDAGGYEAKTVEAILKKVVGLANTLKNMNDPTKEA